MSATPDIFEERAGWSGPIGASVAFHAMLFGSMLLYATLFGGFHGDSWGGGGVGGGVMTVTAVSAIPLPAPPATVQPNVLANESKGVSESLPQQKAEPAPEAIAIPERDARKVRKTQITAQNRKAEPAPEPTNVVPYGQGGPANALPFRMTGGSGGLGITGPGGGDFGSRYAWYVDKVRRIISENWFKYEVGPNVAGAARVYLTFEITRDGRPTNVQVEQSSHVPSLDYSAVNALKRIDSFGALPPDYRGSTVMVEFYFDLSR
jgi:protein TonB